MCFAEDLTPGMVLELGEHRVTRSELLEFARTWDPLALHVDEEVATSGEFGGLIGSGIHTVAIFQRLAVAAAYRQWAVIAGRRLRDVEFIAPLRPDMRVGGLLEIVSVVPVRVDRSLVSLIGSLRASDSTGLLSLAVDLYVQRRP